MSTWPKETRPMRDDAARAEIRDNLDGTLFVEAGAGTGKTTMLVERIVNLVRRGTRMRAIAAITFTEAAATELRDRIRAALQRHDLAEAVAEVDEAAISTLHAFAQRILAEHPVEARLPPTVEVLDDIQAELAFDERWSDFVDVLLSSDDHADEVLLGTAAGLRIDSLREIARVFDDHWDRLEDHEGWTVPERPHVSAEPVTAPLRRALAAREHCRADDDRLLGHLDGLEPLIDRLEAAGSELELLHLLGALPRLSTNVGRKDQWACDVKLIRAECEQAETARQEIITRVRAFVLCTLLLLIRRFALESAAARRADGRLVFHDLLVLARDLVHDNRDVRLALRERFDRVLIDEFQDTDPLQVELAVMLAATDEGDATRPWSDQVLEPGRLFFVGDAMQSIYRFRRADIRLFTQVRSFVEQARHLTDNHRSVPGILSYVNTVFQAMVGGGRDGAQPEYHDLEAARPALPKAPAPVVLLGREHEAPIATVREEEAGEIAETILRIRDEQWQVRDQNGDRGTRPARLHDIAILMPTRATLPQLEAALDAAEVPYRVESASLVWGTQEVRDLLAALRSIDDPTDTISLVAALRSPSFACGDDELLQYVQAGGHWDYRRDAPPALAPEHPVVAAMTELATLHRERWWQSVSGVVERVARELRFFELALAHRRPRDHWRRLRWVVDQARAFEEADGGPLRAFVRWADRQADEHARVKESALPEADDDAVRILTIHGSKGLQFPVVVVTGLNRPPNAAANRPATVLWDGNRPEVSTWGRFKTPGFDGLKLRDGELDEEERIRLLYVALTRAEDHLVISVHHKRRDKSQAMELWELADATTPLWRRLGTPPLRLVQQVADAPATVASLSAVERREWSAQREQLVARLADAPVRAATAVAAMRATSPEADIDGPPWRRGRAGTSIGRAVHAVLQSVDLATGAGLDAIARAQATAEGVEADSAEVARLAAAALGSAAVKRAVAGRHWRELYVAAPIPGTGLSVEGFIDLLYEDAGGLVIVDYKTDSVRSEPDVEATLGRYRLQGATYALALEETLHARVAACVFVFVSGGVARERTVDDLDAAKEEVRALLGAAH
jgi:ATP-dependent exoDNAse (exonuclease V) beta subunit